MDKEKNTLPAVTEPSLPFPSSDVDALWFQDINKKNRKKQTEALITAIDNGESWRVEALLSIPIVDKTFSKSGIYFKECRRRRFNQALRRNNLTIMKIIVEHNGSTESLIDFSWGGSLYDVIDSNTKPDTEIIAFLLDNGANPFEHDMIGIKEAIKSNKIEVIETYIDKVPFTIEPIKDLLRETKNSNIYDILENKLIELEKLRKNKSDTAPKQIAQEQETWFPMGKFQIMHLEQANDPFKTTVRHIFNFKASHVTSCITDNQKMNASKTFNFSSSPELTEFIQEAHNELSKSNKELPKLASVRTISRKQRN